MKKTESIIVVGGGIGGLYVAYKLLKNKEDKKQDKKVIVLEKSDRLGGRVFTFSDSAMTVDTGAGRFRRDHVLLIKLLKELGLYDRAIQNGHLSGHYHLYPDGHRCFIPQKDVDVIRKRLITISKKTAKQKLQSMSFVEFARSVISGEDVDFLLDSFGYYSELVLMNAYDCFRLMGELDSNNKYYSLRGGLSLIIRELSNRIRKMGGVIKTKMPVIELRESEDKFVVASNKGKEYICDAVVFAVTKRALESISYFRPIMHQLNEGLLTAPLCRIYAKYPTDRLWFKGLKKFTVNNELRMVIPISEESGVIMISYSDNKFSEYWQDIYRRGGEAGLNRELKKKVNDVLNIEIPDAEEIRAFYWEAGVGYWGPGVDSDAVSERIIRPFYTPIKCSHNGGVCNICSKRVFVCGENFSATHQQWMEGALETGSRVLRHF